MLRNLAGRIPVNGRIKLQLGNRPILPDGSIAAWGKADGLTASRGKSKGSPCQQDDSSQIGDTKGYSGPNLPEDIWRHIHSLMPLRDAAQAACVYRAFLCSWRSHPNLTFSKETLGLNENARGKDDIARDFTSKIDHILKNHSCTAVKKLDLLRAPNYNAKDRRYLDSWLQMAVRPGIEELTLTLADSFAVKYKFPCSLLSHGNGDSIRSLVLADCAFRPTVGFCCLRSLVRLDLFEVVIKGDELGCLLSNSFALESLLVRHCSFIICVKIPCLQRLTHLAVISCRRLQVIESKAPNLSSFCFAGDLQVQLSLGEALQVKNLYLDCSGPTCLTRAELASSMPNLETLGIHSSSEMVNNTPLASIKFLHLKSLSITLAGLTFSWSFDYFSLVSCPSLETFVLDVSQRLMEDANYDEIHWYSLANVWVYLTCHMLRAWLS